MFIELLLSAVRVKRVSTDNLDTVPVLKEQEQCFS